MATLRYQLVHPNARAPFRGSEEAAGLDLSSIEPVFIPAQSHKLVPLGIKIELPKGTYGRLAGRSGLANKYGLVVAGGVIDSDYRGELGVFLINPLKSDFEMPAGQRICQLIVEKIEIPNLERVENLTPTERNEKGWGSTGMDAMPLEFNVTQGDSNHETQAEGSKCETRAEGDSNHETQAEGSNHETQPRLCDILEQSKKELLELLKTHHS